MVFSASSLYRFCWTRWSRKNEGAAGRIFLAGAGFAGLNWIYLADDVLHLLSVEDVGGVDHRGVGGPVHLCVVLVLGLRKTQTTDEHSDPAPAGLAVKA